MIKIIWTDDALRDLEEIGDYIARENLAAADRIVTRSFEQVDMLKGLPHIGRPGRVEGTRELVVTRTSYLVAYRASTSEVEVLSVIHGARRWPDRFD